MRGLRRTALVGTAVAALCLVGQPAGATPPSGVTARVIAQKTIGGTDYVLREITVAPGGSTGWHYHDGTLYGLVKQGTLTHADATCHTDGVYRRGDPIVEPSGSGNVHIGRNLGSEDVVLEVLYVLPAGSPFSEDAANPGCDFQ